ncbi:MAG: exodeoxyribonuclease V subunit beta [Spirochaetaceae bacterium]|nr:exodeoxyribonuclease V subunit beta [Spirochaetaceae bacterium]
MKPLEPWQLELRGTTLVEASAGTGKTHTLTTLYLRLLVEADLLPARILVVTYTEAATAELRTRVRERIQQAIRAQDPEASAGEAIEEEVRALALRARREAEERGGPDALRRALQAFDEASIFTIHGFCQRTLQEHAFESGMAFDAELVERSEPVERTLAHDLFDRLLREESPDFVAWLLEGGGKGVWRFDPEKLLRDLLGRLGADEEMPVLPEAGEGDGEPLDLPAMGEALVEAWRRWAAAWDERAGAVRDLLCRPNGLNKQSYNADRIATTWLPRLDELARTVRATEDAAALHSIPLPDFWERLTPSGLEAKTNKGKQTPEDPFFEQCAAVLEATRTLDEARHARALALRRRFVDAARAAARDRRERQHRLFFDDLLSELRAALRSSDGPRLVSLLRERHAFALIDEFQDTDPVQYEIFRTVWHRPDEAEGAPGRGLVLIGDPKQAIYSFRGADVHTYLRAHADAADRSYGLDVNWRSDPPLIEAVNTLFGRPANAFGVKEIGFAPAQPREDASVQLVAPGRPVAGLRVLYTDRAAAREQTGDGDPESTKVLPVRFGRVTLMQAMASDVAGLLESGATIEGRPVRASDIAILARRNRDLRAARRALEALGLPCVDRGDASVFDTREAWELASVLRAWLRAADPGTLRGALSSGAHGLGAAGLAALPDDAPELAAISERYAEYGRIWAHAGFARAFETWRRNEGVTARLLAYQDGDRRLTNWLHLAELLQQVAAERPASRAALVGWLETAIETPDRREAGGSEASLLRLERDDEAISLVTLHRSKGLQYPIVYLPSLWADGPSRWPGKAGAEARSSERPPIRFHDSDRGRTLDLGLLAPAYSEHVERAKQEEASEQLRLLYVGLTRAKHQCIVYWGPIGNSHHATALARLIAGGRDGDEADDARRSGWDDAAWLEAWQAFAEDAGAGAVSLEAMDLAPRARFVPPVAKRPTLAFSAPTREIGAPVRTTSFSAIVRDATRGGLIGAAALEPTPGPEVEGRDRDAGVERASLEPSERQPDLAASMHAFPRGAEAGTLLHEVLEQVDPPAFDEASVRRIAREAIARNAVDPDCEDQIVHVVASVAGTPLRDRPTPLRLGDLPPGRLLPEMEFTLAAGEASARTGFDAPALAQLLREAPPGSPLARYASRLEILDWRAIRGYLRGFIDAVFVHDERYYLIDYKSNHLGARQEDYLPERLVEPMIEHDYVLQYLIYSIALDRHLARCLSDYDYERHFGGVYYLFLRGLAVSHAPGCGVFHDRPAASIVRGASQLLGGALGGTA